MTCLIFSINLRVQNALDCISENFHLTNFPGGARTIRRPDGRYRAHIATVYYSQLFLSRTPLGPVLSVRLREMSVL